VVNPATHVLFEKSATNKNVFTLYLQCNLAGNFKIAFSIGVNTGITWEGTGGQTTYAAGQWYHVGATYQDSDKSWHIRIYDANTGAVADTTGNMTNNINIEDSGVTLGNNYISQRFDGLIDEMVIFNDILSSQEIDDIRGLYFPAAQVVTVTEDDD